MVKISVITPTIRKDSLEMVFRCLQRQDFRDFEWIVVSPYKYDQCDLWIEEPPKREGDNYGLNRAWNAAIKRASGELMVSIVDLLWFPPQTLDVLWTHYQANKMSCIGLTGHQYDQIENGKPEHFVWQDPRVRQEEKFYKIPPIDMEWCIASLPIKGLYDVGGIDEKWDQYAALSEKETNVRMSKLGYEFFIDQFVQYRAIYHPRLSLEWDKKYQEGIVYFNECLQKIESGERLRLDFLS